MEFKKIIFKKKTALTKRQNEKNHDIIIYMYRQGFPSHTKLDFYFFQLRNFTPKDDVLAKLL